MTEVQTIQGLPSLDSEGSILAALNKRGIYRLSLIVHQAMADAIDRSHYTLEENQACLRKILLDYIVEEYPAYELVSFVELLKDEAKAISLYLPFGIYMRLVLRGNVYEHEESLPDVIKLLTQ